MSDEVLDTDFLPLDLIKSEEVCLNEIDKCDNLRLALRRHQYELVKLYTKLTNSKLYKFTTTFDNVIVNDYIVCPKKDNINNYCIADSIHYEIENFGDDQDTDIEEIKI